MAFPDAWTEVALVAVTKESGSDYDYATVTETVDISMGDKAVEHIATVHGSRIVKYTPEDDTEITLELYPVELDPTGAAGGFFEPFYGGNWNSTDPISFYNYDNTNSRPNARDKFRVAILWTNLATVTSATGAVASGDALRFVARNCYITSHKVSFTDDIVKVTVTFKCGAANKDGEPNIAWQSNGAATTLLALVAYTPTAWLLSA